MNVSDRLADLLTIRQLLLQRLTAGESTAFNRQLDEIAAELEATLRASPELTDFQGRRLTRAIEELAALVQLSPPELEALARIEAQATVAGFASVKIDVVLPPASVLSSIATAPIVEGATLSEWFAKLAEDMRFGIARAVRTGVSLGQTNAQIAKAILGAAGDKGPEVFPRARRDAMAVTRTGVNAIANSARLSVYEENADVIKAVQWLSTLDSRTSDICIARSGKTWTVPGFKPIKHKIPWNGGPPAHWACRSTVVPITKTFRELGLDRDEVPPSTRASMDGEVAADLSFDEFLKGKPASFADEMLGKGRAQLWRDGKITLSELLNPKGVPLTLEQLEAKYGKPAQ